MEYGSNTLRQPTGSQPGWRSVFQAIAILTALAGLLALLRVEFGSGEQGDLGSLFDSKWTSWLAVWAIYSSVYVYNTVVLKFSALQLSTWGYVWRTTVIAMIGNILADGLDTLAPWNVGRADYLFVVLMSPWILSWMMLRFEDIRRSH